MNNNKKVEKKECQKCLHYEMCLDNFRKAKEEGLWELTDEKEYFAHADECDFCAVGYCKQSEWISVEERLPDEQGHFLIVDKEGQMNTAFYTPRFGWFSHFRIKNITHWMPLPEAPKGGAE